VLEPEGLREEVMETAKAMRGIYKKKEITGCCDIEVSRGIFKISRGGGC